MVTPCEAETYADQMIPTGSRSAESIQILECPARVQEEVAIFMRCCPSQQLNKPKRNDYEKNLHQVHDPALGGVGDMWGPTAKDFIMNSGPHSSPFFSTVLSAEEQKKSIISLLRGRE